MTKPLSTNASEGRPSEAKGRAMDRFRSVICAGLALLVLAPAGAKADHHTEKAAGEKQETMAEKPMGVLEPQGPLAVQILLSCANFSPGEIDGVWGPNTRGALTAFQDHHGLSADGEMDDDTWKALGGSKDAPLLAQSKVTADEAGGPFVKDMPGDMMEQAKLDSLGYTSVEELLAETYHVSPEILRQLNPEASFEQGSTIWVPNLECSGVDAMMASEMDSESEAENEGSRQAETDGAMEGGMQGSGPSGSSETSAEGSADEMAADAAKDDGSKSESMSGKEPKANMEGLTVRVSAEKSDLRVFDSAGKLLFYAPVTAGSEQDPLPKGDWKVVGVAHDPTFHYNPELFWDAEEGDEKTTLPPGPNNPVGKVWIDLDKEHYGLHGTPAPGKVGHTASHGCVRLTNWDALKVASMVKQGTEVIFE